MAYANLATQIVVKGGLEPAYTNATASDGDMFSNTGKEFVHIVNGGGSPCVVTVPTPATVAGLAIEDKTVTVPAGEDRMIGVFEPGYYNQSGANKGKCYVEYDQVTTVTIAVIRI